MPYIDKQIRNSLDPLIASLSLAIEIQSDGTFESEAGLLNYTITKLILASFPSKAKYWQYALVKGILSDIQDEWYRRKTVGYEDMKIATAGDVY